MCIPAATMFGNCNVNIWVASHAQPETLLHVEQAAIKVALYPKRPMLCRATICVHCAHNTLYYSVQHNVYAVHKTYVLQCNTMRTLYTRHPLLCGATHCVHCPQNAVIRSKCRSVGEWCFFANASWVWSSSICRSRSCNLCVAWHNQRMSDALRAKGYCALDSQSKMLLLAQCLNHLYVDLPIVSGIIWGLNVHGYFACASFEMAQFGSSCKTNVESS